MIQRIFFLITIGGVSFYSQAQKCQKDGIIFTKKIDVSQGSYELVLEDDFEENVLDETKWRPINGVPRDFDFTQQKAWHQEENLVIGNGTLKIEAKKLEKHHSGTWITDWSTDPYTKRTANFEYTTGELWSHQKYLYGKYEIRCRLPKGKGLWPAFWTYGGPLWNEIDFFEIYGDDIERYTCNVHHDYDEDGDSENCSFAKKNVADFTQWHTFTGIFDLDKIAFQMDGITIREIYRFSKLDGSPILYSEMKENEWYYQEQSFPTDSMHVIMNLAVQTRKDKPNFKTIFPAVYEIDYVRFYAKRESVILTEEMSAPKDKMEYLTGIQLMKLAQKFLLRE